MTTVALSNRPDRLWPPLSVQEIKRVMLTSPKVLVTAIIVGGVVALGMLVVVGFLVYNGRDTAAILTVVNGLISAFALKAVYDVKAETKRVAENTNGNQSKLIDHVISQSEGATP